MIQSQFLIYALTDAEGHIRYIGKSTSGLRRARNHLRPSLFNRLKTHCAKWIRQSVRSNKRIEISIIQTFERASDLNQAERYWIFYFRSIGCRLTNETAGGEGISGYRLSEETKNKIRMKALGRSPGNKGKPSPFKGLRYGRYSDERRLAIRHGVQTKRINIPWNLGKKWNNETKIKIGNANRKFPRPEETKCEFCDNKFYPKIVKQIPTRFCSFLCRNRFISTRRVSQSHQLQAF